MVRLVWVPVRVAYQWVESMAQLPGEFMPGWPTGRLPEQCWIQFGMWFSIGNARFQAQSAYEHGEQGESHAQPTQGATGYPVPA